MTIEFILNAERVRTDAPAGTLVLDWLRQRKQLVGTKEGCKEGDCGACSVLIGRLEGERVRYEPVTSCLVPLGELHGCHLLTIEGLNLPRGLNPVQEAMVKQGGAQCGFCTPGFIVSMCWYLMQGDEGQEPSEAGFRHAISGNLCRCTGYGSIHRACADLTKACGDGGELKEAWSAPDRIAALTERGALPGGLTGIAERLQALQAAPTEAFEAETPEFVIAGGTDLYVQRGERIPEAEVEVLGRRDDMNQIEIDGDVVVIGARTSFEAFAQHPEIQRMLPTIVADMELIASLPIRNRATLAGNLINASPIGDMTIMLLALGAEIQLWHRGTGESRWLELPDLYLGYKTLAREPDELVRAIRFPAVEPPRTRVNFEKVSKRRCLDIATVNSAARLTLDDAGVVTEARLAVGGVAAVPLYLRRASAWLTGRALNTTTARETLRIAMEEIAPISDVRGSAEYKRLLARQLLAAHLFELHPGRVSLRDLIDAPHAIQHTREVTA